MFSERKYFMSVQTPLGIKCSNCNRTKCVNHVDHSNGIRIKAHENLQPAVFKCRILRPRECEGYEQIAAKCTCPSCQPGDQWKTPIQPATGFPDSESDGHTLNDRDPREELSGCRCRICPENVEDYDRDRCTSNSCANRLFRYQLFRADRCVSLVMLL